MNLEPKRGIFIDMAGKPQVVTIDRSVPDPWGSQPFRNSFAGAHSGRYFRRYGGKDRIIGLNPQGWANENAFWNGFILQFLGVEEPTVLEAFEFALTHRREFPPGFKEWARQTHGLFPQETRPDPPQPQPPVSSPPPPQEPPPTQPSDTPSPPPATPPAQSWSTEILYEVRMIRQVLEQLEKRRPDADSDPQGA